MPWTKNQRSVWENCDTYLNHKISGNGRLTEGQGTPKIQGKEGFEEVLGGNRERWREGTLKGRVVRERENNCVCVTLFRCLIDQIILRAKEGQGLGLGAKRELPKTYVLHTPLATH